MSIAAAFGVQTALPGIARAATTPWSITPSPNWGAQNVINAIACASSTSCVAVGYYDTPASVQQTLTETLNDGTWSVVTSPDDGSGNNVLNAVACTSPTSCVAVGYYEGTTEQTLVETWNGETWTLASSPNHGTGSNYLAGVACVGSTDCVAVGDVVSVGQAFTLVETLSGTTWSVNSSGTVAAEGALTGVSCGSPTTCVAVGPTVTESSSGSEWTPDPTGDSGLRSVSCLSPTDCVGVGGVVKSFLYQTLAETWDGSSWSVVATPDVGTGDDFLNGVSCSSTTSCTAVGYSTASRQQTLVESWSGLTWSVVVSPNEGNLDNTFNGVSCASSTSCEAGGAEIDYTFALGNVGQSLVENWSGSAWSIETTPNEDLFENDLNAVSCFSSTDCMAVGSAADASGTGQTLTESSNGGAWVIRASANASTTANSLNGVSCTSATNCVAVGYYADPSSHVNRTLIENWNGTKWSVATSPDVGLLANQLNSVSCTSATSCVAVGYYSASAATNQTLIESLSGTTWSVVTSANQPVDFNALWGVSCASSTACTAVGAGSQGTLIESLSGGTWSLDSSPDPGDRLVDRLNAVACTSATSCVAVGDYDNDSAADQTLVETLTDGSWTVTSSPNEGTSGRTTLDAVACSSSSTCQAVGFYQNGSGIAQTMIATLSGGSWSLAPSPDANSKGNVLAGVSAAGPDRWVAVGGYGTGGPDQTLVETYRRFTTTTSIVSVTSNPVVGQPIVIGVSAAAPSAGPLTPTGDVTVSDGTQNCNATLSGSRGTATGTCSITEAAPGDYSLTASYAGDSVFVSGSTGSSTAVTVVKATSTSELRLATTKATYGDEQKEEFSATVAPEFTGTPAGTVTVTKATTTLCRITLRAGAGSCSLKATELAAGSAQAVATYSGSTDFTASVSGAETLTVEKATTKTALKLSRTSIKYGDETAERISITVSPQFADSEPSRTVRVTESKTTLCTIRLSSGKGKCTLSSKRLAAGKYSLIATYSGSSDFHGSNSSKATLTVTK
jgi:hypothetical protein